MPPSTCGERVRFGIFEADLRSGELYRQGRRIKLHQQPFRVLALLLQHPGEVVTREELQRKLWPSDTFVNFDICLNSAIRKLRGALNDSAEGSRYVETLPRRGYRFIAPVIAAAASEHRSEPEASVSEIEAPAPTAFEQLAPESSSSTRDGSMRWTVVGVATALLLLVPWLTALNHRRQGALAEAAPVRISSIAVLPLENLSGDPAREYFADSMTEALTTNLAQIGALTVISRNSASRYKGSNKPAHDIARELGVDAIVTGAVMQSGDRVRVDAQLVDGATERNRWAQEYERDLGEVINLQGEIARAIANEIRVKLTPDERTRLQRAESIDPETYALYAKGRYLFNTRSLDWRKSIDYLQQAIQRRKDFGLAYAALAEAHVIRFDAPPADVYSAAKAAAAKALALDDTLAEAHNALAMCLFEYDWNWAGAEKEFQRALALNPNYAQAHHWYSQYLRAMGRKSWLDEIKRAGELDPLSPAFPGAGQYMEAGQYDEAIKFAEKKLEVNPSASTVYLLLGRAYVGKGEYTKAIESVQKSVNLDGGGPAHHWVSSLSLLGYLYGVSGNRAGALDVLRQLERLSERTYVPPSDRAWVYVGLGDKDRAFYWLQKALADRSIPIGSLRLSHDLDSLRSDPRFAELKRRVGLPD